MDLQRRWIAKREAAGWESNRQFCDAAGVVKDTITWLLEGRTVVEDTMDKMLTTFNVGRQRNGLAPLTRDQFKEHFPRWAIKEAVECPAQPSETPLPESQALSPK